MRIGIARAGPVLAQFVGVLPEHRGQVPVGPEPFLTLNLAARTAEQALESHLRLGPRPSSGPAILPKGRITA